MKRKILEQLISFIFAAIIMFLLLCAFSYTVYGCKPLPPDDPTDVDAGIVYTCETACARVITLRCDGWNGSAGPDNIYGSEDDLSCLDVCSELIKDFDLHLPCISESLTCLEVNTCFE